MSDVVVTNVLAMVIGLVAGLLSGLVFERRARRAAEEHNDELRRQLGVLKATVQSLGGNPNDRGITHHTDDLSSSVTTRALGTQDPSGRVDTRELVAYFVERGDAVTDVHAAISSLCQTGVANEEGSWLQMK